ncbi:MAG: enoyl-CoA hydratase/isomerase family protein [Deltaproteobacteria bacterium]|nr:enoyl-CoA hydratase/isomerase family protein [Deltaproteobacteria bacterium]
MECKNILFQVEEQIATITFNRPEVLNALNEASLKEFSHAVDNVAGDEDIRVLILTGAGDKSFVAGADITEFLKFNALKAKIFSETGHGLVNKLQELPIPVIAAVNGFALGGGCEVVIACDFIYASENAMFGLPEINLGIIPGFGGTQRLPRLIGKNRAKEMIFTGKMIPAAEAQAIGLVNKVCAQDQLMDEVLNVAKIIVSKGKVSMRAAKQAINTGMDVDLKTGCRVEIDAFAICLASPDAKEGTQAFLEKRAADFKGGLRE